MGRCGFHFPCHATTAKWLTSARNFSRGHERAGTTVAQ
ncbi:hypothetical protein BURMUCF1_1210 [Burkholderia multivorans ATCC BAA-247]|nr:hypothetical protein BURMUCF1_1210 [Burkholderia multivorans ATCC BAA-247]